LDSSLLYTANPVFCVEQNPALRHDLSFEMGQMNSDVGLHFGDAPHDPVLKQEMLFRRKAEMHPTRAADRGFHTAPMMQLPALQGAELPRRQSERLVGLIP